MSPRTNNPAQTEFGCFRHSIVPNGQTSLWQDEGFEKRDIVRELIAHCFEGNIASSDDAGTDQLIRVRRVANEAYLFKLCKARDLTTFSIDNSSLEVLARDGKTYPFVYVIFDPEVQVVLVSKKAQVYGQFSTAANALTKVIKHFADDPNYLVSLEPITDRSSFWQAIDDADRVKNVTFKLLSPNFLGAGYGTNEFLKKLNRATNSDKSTFALHNDEGQLKIEPEEFGDTVLYVADGGGSWELETSKDGMKQIHRSSEHTRSVLLLIGDAPSLDDGDTVKYIREIGKRKGEEDDDADAGEPEGNSLD